MRESHSSQATSTTTTTPRRRGLPALLRALPIVATLFGAPALATGLEWAHYKPECTNLVSDLAVPCGAYGIFHFGPVTDPGGSPPECDAPLASNPDEELSYYPLPKKNSFFPAGPPLVPNPGPGVQHTENAFQDPWMAVLDWDDSHGETVEWILEAMSILDVDGELYDLADPALSAALGAGVTDARVLVKMCAANEDRVTARPELLGVNMSFGRAAGPNDPAYTPCSTGDADTLPCQISLLGDHLRSEGVPLVAAAGNQKELLFPATLDSTLAIGTIDVREYVESLKVVPTWESPSIDRLDGVVPGHALCPNTVVAPSGSSFAAALFSGWMGQALVEDNSLDMYTAGPGPWEPVAVGSCFSLGKDGVGYTSCNGGLAILLDGILHGAASGCWEEAIDTGKTIVAVGLTGKVRTSEPAFASHSQWVAQHQPAPGEDPCVPCMGGLSDDGFQNGPESSVTELVLNLSSTPELTGTAALDGLWLRIDDDFLELDISETDLQLMTSGEIGALTISGLDAYLGSPTPSQSSLISIFNSNPLGGRCVETGDDDCWWTSSIATLP